MIKKSTDMINNMDESQLNNMINMMKNNKEHVRQMYRAQGMEMSDEQLKNITKMMNPEMLKTASQMMSSNPDMVKQMSEQLKRNQA